MIVLVTPPRGAELCAAIAGRLQEKQLPCRLIETMSLDMVEDLAEVEILLSLLVPVGAAQMDRMPRLRAVVSPLLGYDWIDTAAASERGIAVVNSEVVENREGMAEATIMLLLALLYRLHETEALLRTNVDGDPLQRHMLKGRTIGVIGYGGISRAVIQRLSGWGCRFLVHSRGGGKDAPGIAFVSLDHLLAESDAILVLTGLDPSTYHMLSYDQFARMRPGVLLVNTARGAIIDEQALIDALRSGRVASAALDVFRQEPLDPTSPLRSIPNLILTPHAIGHNEEAKAAAPRLIADNIEMLVEGCSVQDNNGL